VQVSAVTLGSMLLHEIPEEADAARLLDRALDHGINAVDTANVYGRGASEERLGRLLSRSGRRDRLVLSSKFHARMDDDDPNAAGSSRRHVIDECDTSLRRLQTDHLDIYYIHRPTSRVPIDETLRALDDLVRTGKIRYIGTSSFASWQLIESLWVSKELHLSRVVVEQSPYSLVDRRVERELVPMAQSYGIGITVWSPLAGGLLTGKYAGDSWPQDARFTSEPANVWEERHFTPATRALVGVVLDMAKAKGCTPTQLSLAWILQRPGVSSVVLGTRNTTQLDDQVGAVGMDFTDEELARIDQIAPPGRATVPYYLDDGFADWSPALHRW
jgi:aryl-alcohol dehydrogenase-like predicted oxidoreductase